jgi:hypothetical protein
MRTYVLGNEGAEGGQPLRVLLHVACLDGYLRRHGFPRRSLSPTRQRHSHAVSVLGRIGLGGLTGSRVGAGFAVVECPQALGLGQHRGRWLVSELRVVHHMSEQELHFLRQYRNGHPPNTKNVSVEALGGIDKRVRSEEANLAVVGGANEVGLPQELNVRRCVQPTVRVEGCQPEELPTANTNQSPPSFGVSCVVCCVCCV